ncbi:MAG TPA: S8 family serine peptidase [Roseiflexaceae bacterium]|nr:S8 family serine peptidase [Roseiflexaceae bacterium]
MRRFALLIVLILALASGFSAGATPRLVVAPPRLRLHRATFDVRAAGRTAPTAALAVAAPGPYAIIQFGGPIGPADRAALERTGVKLLEYLPEYAYLVGGDAAQLDAAARLPQVYARAPFTLADKLAPPLLRALARGDTTPTPLRIVAWPGAEEALQRDLRARRMVGAAVPTAELLQIAGLASVRWIEPMSRPRLLNDVARTIMHVDTAAWQGQNLFGANQVVAVADSGLDTGVMATISPDFAGRIIATHVLSAGGELGDQHGHGTHVAGSVAGAGVQSGANPGQHHYAGSFAGVAPEAQLVVQAFEALPDGTTIGVPSDYYTLFQQAYADGARIHTNSWGDYTGPIADPEASFGGYPSGAQRTDQFIWDHPDMAVFFAAGNSGADGTPGALGFCTGGNGVVDPDSLLSPGTAKNVVTVGAAETQRASGGASQTPWLLLSFCFATQPISTDLVSNNPSGMAAFSSRGPTDDGRTKPDIVAPGTDIISARSHYSNAGTLWGPYDDHYSYSGGTSMATPLAAGAGTLVREWLVALGIANPSSAAVKAALLNTAHDMAPGQYGTGLTQEIPDVRPNSVAGWGRVDLGFMDAPSPYALWVDDHTTGISTGQQVSYADTAARPLEVRDSAQPLRVMLAWTDPPASLSAARQLVNDLDLRVIGPSGTVYYGNNVATGDRINNVEGIVIDNPPVGQYSVEVRGFNVPIATQPYALAVARSFAEAGQMTLTKTANPASYVQPGGLITYTLQARAQGGPLSSVVLSDTLPANTSFVSASGAYTRSGPNNSVIAWSVGNLPAGQSVARTLTVRVSPTASNGETISNTSYSVSAAGVPPISHPPVNVVLQESLLTKRIWLPRIAR